MATSSPSPASPLATPPTSTMTPPPSPSIPTPDPPTETNANPPESSTVSPPAPPVASPPPDSPTPSEPPPTSPTPVATSPPLVSATSPPPPTADPPAPSVDAPPPSSPPSPPSSTTPTPTNTLPNSPPPPSPPTTIAPPVTSPPSDPQTLPPPPAAETNSPPPPSTETSSPPPPAAETNSPPPPSTETSSPPPPTTETNSPPPSTTKTKSPPPSKSSPPQSSPPPPPVSESQPPESQPPPPSVSGSTYPPPPSTKHTPEPPSSPQSPKSSPSSPSASPSKDSPSTPTSQISPTVSHLSPPPVSSTTLGSLVPSSSPNQPSDNSKAGSPSKGGVPMGGIVAIGLMVGFIMLGLISLVVCCIYKRKRKDFKHNGRYIVPSPYGSSPRSDSNLIVKTAVSSSTPFVRTASGSGALSPDSHGGLHSRSWFTYQELYEATNGFALEHLLGEGGFGSVYKGVLTNGKEIAVKQLKIGGSQGEREFQAEVEIISRIHHRHLVSLVGYCMFESKRLLVYEYVPNQTLYYHLHGENRPVMDWATRIKIAVGAARGIAYLHEDCHPRIIHRDIKSSNILLDNKFEARVADFGLAKLALDVDTHVSTRVMGTFGYMAPEYATSGKLTDKSDVYSFGVVLLELLTGRKPVDSSQPLGDESLVEWARPLLSHALETGQVEGLVDPRLEKSCVESELYLMTEAAAACVRHSATKRPRMAQVVRAFDGLSPSDLSNGMRVGQSEVYDSAQQSAEIRWFRRMAFGSQDYSTDYFSEAARNSTGILNPNQNNQGPIFSTQHSRSDLTQQQSQNIYFSSQRTQGSAFSNQLSQDSTLLRQSSQNLAFQKQSSENLTFLGAA